MSILMLILNNISKFAIAVLGLFSLYSFSKNKKLKNENEDLIKEDNTNKKVIEVQKKVINVTKEYKPVNISDNIKRMRENKL